MKKRSLAPYLILAFLVFLPWFAILESSAETASRYRVIFTQYSWRDSDTLPYQILREMCWNETEGFCDAGMDEFPHRLAYIISFRPARHGLIMQVSTGCFLWWFEDEIDENFNPHIAEAYWIVCDAR